MARRKRRAYSESVRSEQRSQRACQPQPGGARRARAKVQPLFIDGPQGPARVIYGPSARPRIRIFWAAGLAASFGRAGAARRQGRKSRMRTRCPRCGKGDRVRWQSFPPFLRREMQDDRSGPMGVRGISDSGRRGAASLWGGWAARRGVRGMRSRISVLLGTALFLGWIPGAPGTYASRGRRAGLLRGLPGRGQDRPGAAPERAVPGDDNRGSRFGGNQPPPRP